MKPQKPKKFASHGIPPLEPCFLGKSPSIRFEVASPIDAQQAHFAICDDIELRETGGTTLWTHFPPDWTSQFDIWRFTTRVFLEAITATKLPRGVCCFSDLFVPDLRSYVLPFTFNGNPIGVIEPQVPDPRVMDHETIHAHIFDDMMALRAFEASDTRSVLSPLTKNGKSFGCRKAASAANNKLPSLEERHVETKDETKEEEDDSSKVLEAVPTELPRRCFRGGVFKWNDPQLPKLLCSLLHKMLASPVSPRRLIEPSRPYAVLTAESFRWCSIDWGRGFRLTEEELPLPTDDEFVLLKDLEEGRWLACTLSGRSCVIVFPHPRDFQAELTQNERCAKWIETHSAFEQVDRVRALRLVRHWCLLLPRETEDGG